MFERKVRASIARVLNDLIQADTIIDVTEMEKYDEAKVKFGLDRSDFEELEAHNITFAQAWETIVSDGRVGEVTAFLRSMALADGFCATSEALILYPFMLAQEKKKCKVFSVKSSNFEIADRSVLYVEDNFDEHINNIIAQNWRKIKKEFQVAGFDFIYLPHVIDYYRNNTKGENLLKKIICFLSPQKSEKRVDELIEELLDMNTANFCLKMSAKIDMQFIRNTSPSLLMKIGNDYVGNELYTNYLQLDIDDNVIAFFEMVVDDIASMQRVDVKVIEYAEQRDGLFFYHGFYKQLLDIILIQKTLKSNVEIDYRRSGSIVFKDIDNLELKQVNRKEKAFYALLLSSDKSDGLDFTPPKDNRHESIVEYDERLDQIQKRFKEIYCKMGGDKDKCPDIRDGNIRRPIMSRLRGNIEQLNDKLGNYKEYLPYRHDDGKIYVDIDRAYIKFVEY